MHLKAIRSIEFILGPTISILWICR